MTGLRLRWRPVRLALTRSHRSALAGAAGDLGAREGLVLAVEDGAATGWGEALPLPLPGQPAAADLAGLLALEGPALLAEPQRAPPALRCALESALLDLAAQSRGVPLAALLTASGEPPPPGASLDVNAVIGGDRATPDQVAETGRALVDSGFGAVKLKVGVQGVDADLARAGALRQQCPGARIRLDANGAWHEQLARRAVRSLEPLDIEFIEEPLPAGDVPGLRRLRELSAIPVAADETLAEARLAERVIEERAADVLVLKPAVLGGVVAAARLAARARSAGIGAVVTTTIDSSLGTALALQLAASIETDAASAGARVGSGRAHGLSTGLFFADDLVATPLLPGGGRMTLPARPGLGIAPVASAIERCATGPWSQASAPGASIEAAAGGALAGS